MRWTRIAIADLDDAHAYVAADGPQAANRLIDRMEEAVSVLARHPSAGRPARVPGAREIVVPGTPYVVPYRVQRGVVQILSVLHASRKWPDKF